MQAGLPNLDRLIHERIRLGIVSALASGASLSFTELKELLQTTDGNLSRHASKLEEAGYIASTKSLRARMPLTKYSLTDPGRQALERYLGHMEAVIRAARGGGASRPAAKPQS
ncbi:MAG: transcriptional regulator [Acidobacteriota bacterium]